MRIKSIVCNNCFLVQLEEYVSPEHIFTEYAYFSSYATTWLQHAQNYTNLMTERFDLTDKSFVVEVASNDGYLLQYFVQKKIPVLGIEPAKNVAKVAIEKGVPTLTEFFGVKLAEQLRDEGKQDDLIAGNNVLAQVPDINDFVGGMKILLKPSGVITIEFPHLMRLMEENQFDTIYHEHFSNFSFITAEKIFAAHGLTLFDVEELPTHGGSLRIYARHTGNETLFVTDRARELHDREVNAGFTKMEHYQKTAHDGMVRMALVPRCLEARGLDVNPGIKAKLIENGDATGGALLDIILRDEIGHVAIGNRWFHYYCQQRNLDVESTYRQLLDEYLHMRLRPPFHLEARRAAGFSEAELAYLEGVG